MFLAICGEAKDYSVRFLTVFPTQLKLTSRNELYVGPISECGNRTGEFYKVVGKFGESKYDPDVTITATVL